jgi:hypothetical protein
MYACGSSRQADRQGLFPAGPVKAKPSGKSKRYSWVAWDRINMLPVTVSRCHPRTVRARRVTGFWSRPLAGIDGPNVSWKRSDVAYPASCLCSDIVAGRIGVQHERFVTGPPAIGFLDERWGGMHRRGRWNEVLGTWTCKK